MVGYAYLDSDVIASKFFPTAVGFPLANVPKQTFNLFVTHNLPWRFNGGFGTNYVGNRTASSTVPYVPTGYAINPEWPRLCGHKRCHKASSWILGFQRHAKTAP